MKMEILLESISNKLMVEHAEYDESNTYVLERFNTSAGNPVKKILLKLNLSDHRLCKMVVELSCLLKEQLLEPALNLTVHCCGLEFRVLNGYDQKSLDKERGLNCVVQTLLP
ncbi:hypothetical protein Tco_0782674 [Tanacetum coccineum]